MKFFYQALITLQLCSALNASSFQCLESVPCERDMTGGINRVDVLTYHQLNELEKLKPIERGLVIIGSELSQDTLVIQRLLKLKHPLKTLVLENDLGLLKYAESNLKDVKKIPSTSKFRALKDLSINSLYGKVHEKVIHLPWLDFMPKIREFLVCNSAKNYDQGLNKLSACIFSMAKQLEIFRFEGLELLKPNSPFLGLKYLWAENTEISADLLSQFPNLKHYGPDAIIGDDLSCLPASLVEFTVDGNVISLNEHDIYSYLKQIEPRAVELYMSNLSYGDFDLKGYKKLELLEFQNCHLKDDDRKPLVTKLPQQLKYLRIIDGGNLDLQKPSLSTIMHIIETIPSLQGIGISKSYYHEKIFQVLQKNLKNTLEGRRFTLSKLNG